MKLRTKLVVAFFLLAVVPLAGVSIYAYNSSLRAVRQTAEAETGVLAGELGDRMESVSAELSRRIQRLGGFPFGLLMAQGNKDDKAQKETLMKELMSQVGDTASLIRALEFVPAPGPAGQHPPTPFPPPHPPGVRTPPPPAGSERHGLMIHMPGDRGDPMAEDPAQKAAKDAPQVWMHMDAPPEPLTPPTIPGYVPDLEAIRKLQEFARQSAEKQAAEFRKSIEERRRAQEAWRKTLEASRDGSRAPGQDFAAEVRQDGELVGQVKAQISTRQLLHHVLTKTQRMQGEIPFAMDSEGRLYAADPRDLPKIESLPIPNAKKTAGQGFEKGTNWVIVTRKDPISGMTFGIARPIADRLAEIRRTAMRNLLYGMGMVGLALIGILPLSSRMTRNLTRLSQGAEELAKGNLAVRVQINSKDEIGQLARAFNRMAEDLDENQKRALEQERLRKELEMCRKIQEELLPKQPYRSGLVEVRGMSVPAREVGGDFFNYFPLPGGELAIVVGDVSGKGLPAALLMANLQATIHAKLPLEPDLARLAEQLDREIAATTPPEVYLTLFLAVLETETRVLRYVNAGHNSQFALRADGGVERLESTGRPLGLLPGGDFLNRRITMNDGDSLFFYTDGLVESENGAGEELGMNRLEALLLSERSEGLDRMLASVEKAAREFRGTVEAADDATMVLLRIGAPV